MLTSLRTGVVSPGRGGASRTGRGLPGEGRRGFCPRRGVASARGVARADSGGVAAPSLPPSLPPVSPARVAPSSRPHSRASASGFRGQRSELSPGSQDGGGGGPCRRWQIDTSNLLAMMP